MKSLSCVQLLATPLTEAHQAPLSMGKSAGVGCHCLLQYLLASYSYFLNLFQSYTFYVSLKNTPSFSSNLFSCIMFFIFSSLRLSLFIGTLAGLTIPVFLIFSLFLPFFFNLSLSSCLFAAFIVVLLGSTFGEISFTSSFSSSGEFLLLFHYLIFYF